MATYPLRGGPCDGQRSRDFTILPLENFTVFCGGHDYDFSRSARAFLDAGVSFGDTSPTMGARAHNAYHDIQRAVNVTMAGATALAASHRHAAYRRLARQRR